MKKNWQKLTDTRKDVEMQPGYICEKEDKKYKMIYFPTAWTVESAPNLKENWKTTAQKSRPAI